MNDVMALRAVFLLQPLVLGAWFPRIPQVQATIGLSEGALAFALVGMPIGLLMALSFGSRIAEALGTRGLLTLGLGTYLGVMPLPAFATSWFGLFAALMLAGTAMAIAQLSLNVTASEFERRSETLIMNGCHGFWSVGVLFGAAAGSVMAEVNLAPGLSLTFMSAICLFPLLWVARTITDYTLHTPVKPVAPRAWPSRPLLGIAFFGFGIATTEGAMADWLAVFMTNAFAASPGIAGAGYTLFALSVALGRFSGDALKARIDVARLAQALVTLALAGLGLVVLGPSAWVSFIGVAMLGFGVSLGFPLAVSAASSMPGRTSAGNVAILTQVTLCGFLVGPPVIGLVAEVSNMRIGLAALFPALLLALGFARFLRPR